MIATTSAPALSRQRERCRKKFLRNFRGGFYGEKYISWERNYKLAAHEAWVEQLNQKEFERLLENGRFDEIAQRAIRIESRTNLLFSFEKMALRDGVRTDDGARIFANGLFQYLHGQGPLPKRFDEYKTALANLPRKQTRVLTWPVLTVFAFIAQPDRHIYLKPRVTQVAAENYGFIFEYSSKPNWNTYRSLLYFAEQVREDIADLEPRDMIDIQSFIWVQGSDEYV